MTAAIVCLLRYFAEKSRIPVSLPEKYEKGKEDINCAGLLTL